MPPSIVLFDTAVSRFCPERCDLMDMLPSEDSFEHWADKNRIAQSGHPYSAGRGAMEILQFYVRLREAGAVACSEQGRRPKQPLHGGRPRKLAATARLRRQRSGARLPSLPP